MKKVLAITVALMIAAIIITPALGYTNQAAGNQSYTVKSGEHKGNYSVSGLPSNKLAPDALANKYSFKSSDIQSTMVPYSAKLEGVDNALLLGSLNKKTVTETVEAAPVEAVPAVEANTTEVAPAEVQKFTIEGIVFDDKEGNGLMDNNETGLAGWALNLEQPAGTVISTQNTGADGKFTFTDLAAGEYIVSEVVQMGWNIVSPAEGKQTLTITNESVTNLLFANKQG
jgi:uncharacterized protein YxeA